jgi:hypothetical protein
MHRVGTNSGTASLVVGYSGGQLCYATFEIFAI